MLKSPTVRDDPNGDFGGPVLVKHAVGESRERLRREARLLSALNLEGVVRFVGFEEFDEPDSSMDPSGEGSGSYAGSGERQDRSELRLAYLEAATLAEHPGLELGDLLGLLCELGRTLAELHRLGIAHGCLNRDHVLVTKPGRPVLCGFGGASGPESAQRHPLGVDLEALASIGEIELVRSARRAGGASLLRFCDEATIACNDLAAQARSAPDDAAPLEAWLIRLAHVRGSAVRDAGRFSDGGAQFDSGRPEVTHTGGYLGPRESNSLRERLMPGAHPSGTPTRAQHRFEGATAADYGEPSGLTTDALRRPTDGTVTSRFRPRSNPRSNPRFSLGQLARRPMAAGAATVGAVALAWIGWTILAGGSGPPSQVALATDGAGPILAPTAPTGQSQSASGRATAGAQESSQPSDNGTVSQTAPASQVPTQEGIPGDETGATDNENGILRYGTGPNACPQTPAPDRDGESAESVPEESSNARLLDIDGDGCPEEVRVTQEGDGALKVDSPLGSWTLGGPGFLVGVGDWNCDGRATPAALEVASGRVGFYGVWPTAGSANAPQRYSQVPTGATAVTTHAATGGPAAGESGSGADRAPAASCDVLVVHHGEMQTYLTAAEPSFEPTWLLSASEQPE